MKIVIMALMVFASLLTAGAEEATRTAATTAANPFETAGTLISYNATTKALVVATPESTAPIGFTTNTETELVDEANNPLSVGALRDNVPVTVFYAKSPTEMIATKVIVRRVVTAPE
jgi:hypothetical protein